MVNGGVGRKDGRKDGQMDVTKFPPVFYRTSALWGHYPRGGGEGFEDRGGKRRGGVGRGGVRVEGGVTEKGAEFEN